MSSFFEFFKMLPTDDSTSVGRMLFMRMSQVFIMSGVACCSSASHGLLWTVLIDSWRGFYLLAVRMAWYALSCGRWTFGVSNACFGFAKELELCESFVLVSVVACLICTRAFLAIVSHSNFFHHLLKLLFPLGFDGVSERWPVWWIIVEHPWTSGFLLR